MQDRIRLALEQDLRSGALLPGDPIDEQELCERFQASRTPVREALLLLSAKGMISILPRAGIYVRQLETRELIAMMEGVGELEGVVARLAANRINNDQKERLRQALEDTRACAQAADSIGYEQANVQLHDLIYQSSGNAFIVEQTREARLRVAPYRGKMFEKPERLLRSQAEHEAVVTAIINGDSEGAAEAMRNHISAGGRAFADMVLAAPVPQQTIQSKRRKRKV
ncbi:GntR family transcriptional regulator [Diaphorobacter sp. HDW4A]|uniref:GntR family transcriptional regulator n=1 Tax=Diaphorobacter sp. HDW4A TaxID=2714924 RepID=UPI00140DF62C|nr:GntR family transcriptional regulator [Diaphorobacter sp. HDW4A]QIL79067.1 GntR family transcriptional regulator [Diaphorobacter sp. HDW4A]